MKKAALFFLIFCYIFVYGSKESLFDYTIKKEDSLLVVCELFQVSREELEKLNGKEKLDRFWQGDVLKIPLKNLKIEPYTVKKGDTVFDLVKKTGADIEKIYALNDSRALERMWVGEKLLLPIPFQAPEKPQKEKKEPERKSGPNPGELIEYTVQKGDSFFGLSRKFNTPVETLKAAYPHDTLYAGSVIRISVPALDLIRIDEPLKGKRTPSRFSVPGLHYEAEKNDSVLSPMEGEVIGVRHLKGFGRAIFLRHKETIAILASKGYESILVSYGYQLKREQALATVRRGYFVHFFLLKDNVFVAPESFIKGN